MILKKIFNSSMQQLDDTANLKYTKKMKINIVATKKDYAKTAKLSWERTTILSIAYFNKIFLVFLLGGGGG